MFSIRFKLLIFLIVAGVLSVLFVQNQQLITLKFFCADLQGACLYRSPNLPLAVWLGGFILTGIITSSIWQFLNSLNANARSARVNSQSYASVRENNSYIDERNYRSNLPDWEQPNRDDWNVEAAPSETTTTTTTTTSNFMPTDGLDERPSKTDYEVKQQPTSVRNSGSTYSYKYREAEPKPPEPDSSQVYDANYRTLNSNPVQPTESTSKDDDEDWV